MHWLGAVEINDEIVFSFILDAFSGMGLSVSSLANTQTHFLTVDEFANRDLSHPPDISPYAQTATDAAYRFFRQTEIVSVTLEEIYFGNVQQVFQGDTNMVIGVNTQGRILAFTAIDIFGREVSVLVSCDLQAVIGVQRQL
jgi:hypothetical protein